MQMLPILKKGQHETSISTPGLPRLVRRQEENTAPENDGAHYRKDYLGFPATLDQSCLAAILHDRARVIGEPVNETSETEQPKDNTEGKCHTPLQARGLFAKVEGNDDC